MPGTMPRLAMPTPRLAPRGRAAWGARLVVPDVVSATNWACGGAPSLPRDAPCHRCLPPATGNAMPLPVPCREQRPPNNMSGVAGFIQSGQLPDAGHRLKAMTDRIRHRGPDGEGFFVRSSADGRHTIGLGHRRLTILDLAAGDQPITHPLSGVTLVINGEIDNCAELRAELEASGYHFQTGADTEVLLIAYIEWGPRCVERLLGIYAFALWDDRRQRLMLARDHFGKKPLFIQEQGGRLLFASEIKAMLAFGDIAPTLDRAALADFFVSGDVAAPFTLFAGIRELMPGSYAIWQGGHLTETTFCRPPHGEPTQLAPVADPVAAFAAGLDEAVRVRMVADAPFGALLSGGLDSSAIVALMTRHSLQPINTFSVGFREAQYSELPYAAMIAQRFRTNHTALTITADDVIQHIGTLIERQDAPVAEAASLPIYLIAREAAKSVKMVLTGEGSEQLFGNYPNHSAQRFAPLDRRGVFENAPDRAAASPIDAPPYGFRRVRLLAASLARRDPVDRMAHLVGVLTHAERDKLSSGMSERPPDGYGSASEPVSYFDQGSRLPNLLERGDRVTMAASIEARVPFMDIDLARLMARLPDAWRIRGLTQKSILRRAMQNILPQSIVDRPRVQFRVPINEWCRGPMRSFVHELLEAPGSLAQALCDRATIDRTLAEQESGRRDHGRLVWMLLNLELFQRQFRLSY
jgi:asparagine synthase (glutamine-hydrolysing)